MNYEILLAFSIGMIILAATPGPGVLASISRAISEGFKSALFFIGGLVIGDILFFLLAIIGMTTISRLMGQLFFLVKIIGGIFLVYLGINNILKRKSKISHNKLKYTKSKSLTGGLLVTLGNPKPILFYASIVPTIIDINQINFYEIFAFILIITIVSFVVVGLYCYLSIVSKSIIAQQKYQDKLNIVSGFVMIAVGLYIILKKG